MCGYISPSLDRHRLQRLIPRNPQSITSREQRCRHRIWFRSLRVHFRRESSRTGGQEDAIHWPSHQVNYHQVRVVLTFGRGTHFDLTHSFFICFGLTSFHKAEKYNISSKEQRSASIVFAFAPFDYVSVEDQRNKRTLLIGQVVRSKQSSSRVILSLFVHPV